MIIHSALHFPCSLYPGSASKININLYYANSLAYDSIHLKICNQSDIQYNSELDIIHHLAKHRSVRNPNINI